MLSAWIDKRYVTIDRTPTNRYVDETIKTLRASM